jgi:hypothetical protein
MTKKSLSGKNLNEEFRKLINGLNIFFWKRLLVNIIQNAYRFSGYYVQITDFVLDGLEPIRIIFKTIVGADEVTISKPDPETCYQMR